MNEFPLDNHTWYQKRDDRTNRVGGLKEYSNYHVGIIVDPNIESSFALQCMTILSCNMLSRWSRKITIEMPDCKSFLPQNKNQNLKDNIEQLISQIDPYGEFVFNEVSEDVSGILVIGQTEKKLKKPFTWINSSGWIAGCGFGSGSVIAVDSKNINPIGPAFASCMGVSEIFSRAVKQQDLEFFQKWYSLYDFGNTARDPRALQNPEFCSNLEFGTVYQIGCGAVGSSLDYLISLTDWKGRFFLIDKDTISYSNCNRSLPFTAYDAIKPRHKIERCNEIMISDQRAIHQVDKTYSEFTGMEESTKNPPDLILSLANAENVWSTIQNNYPPIVLHATTTQNWGINFGRHIPRKEWCILCRFGENLKDGYTPVCEEGVISTKNNEEIHGVLPFLSPAAAVIMLAEMAKINLESFPINENFVNMSLQRKFGHIPLQINPKTGCMCNTQSFDILSKLRKSSKFWRFVE